MLKIFPKIRACRNENLLEILSRVAKAAHPVSPSTIMKSLGERGRAYSNVYNNMLFLENKGFLYHMEDKQENRQRGFYRKQWFAITVKGALAVLFSTASTSESSELLEKWRETYWGEGQPFRNVKDAAQLKKFVETIYLHEGSLEEIDENVLQRGIRNPEEVMDFIRHATLKTEKKIDESGKYVTKIPYAPSSVSTSRLRRHDGSHGICIVVMPDEETADLLYAFMAENENNRRRIELSLLTFLNTMAKDVATNKGGAAFHYSTSFRTFVLTATIPEVVSSFLGFPEQIPKLLMDSYYDVLRPFMQGSEFPYSDKSYLFCKAFKYDPLSRRLLFLSKNEIKEKMQAILKEEGSRIFE